MHQVVSPPIDSRVLVLSDSILGPVWTVTIWTISVWVGKSHSPPAPPKLCPRRPVTQQVKGQDSICSHCGLCSHVKRRLCTRLWQTYPNPKVTCECWSKWRFRDRVCSLAVPQMEAPEMDSAGLPPPCTLRVAAAAPRPVSAPSPPFPPGLCAQTCHCSGLSPTACRRSEAILSPLHTVSCSVVTSKDIRCRWHGNMILAEEPLPWLRPAWSRQARRHGGYLSVGANRA